MRTTTPSGVILPGTNQTMRHLCCTHGFHVAWLAEQYHVGKCRMARPFGRDAGRLLREVLPTADMFDSAFLLVNICGALQVSALCVRGAVPPPLQGSDDRKAGEWSVVPYGPGASSRYDVSVPRSCVSFATGPARHEFDTRPTLCSDQQSLGYVA